jgi:hypothetical protein
VWKNVCAIYPNQRLTLIGNDEHEATYAAPGWPFGAEGAILIINDGPEVPLEVQVRPKDAFDCAYDAAKGYYCIRSRRGALDPAGLPLRLLLRVTPAAPARTHARAPSAPQAARPIPPAPAPATPAPPSARPAVWKPRTPADSEMTALPAARQAEAKPAPALAQAELDATFAPVARQRVALAALALPRLSRYRETGARALEIGLDRALAPCGDKGDAILSFAVDHEDGLHAITAAGRERITAPASFNPLDTAPVELLAISSDMADRYSALLRLPQAPSLPVAPGARFAFGRGTPVLAALRVLDSPRYLKNGEGLPATSADRLGLSRNAFSFEAVADGYHIARLSPTQALYHLDENLGFVAEIKAATPEAPYRLPAGHHLVAGHYVLRFEA